MSAELGRIVIVAIWRRALAWPILVFCLTVLAVILTSQPGWFTVGGGVISAIGTLHWAKRLTRLRPNRVEEPLPPAAWSAAELLKMGVPVAGPALPVRQEFFDEVVQRANDNWHAFIGVWLTIAGGIVAGALPFLWGVFWPKST